jgi:hypothetical protein
VKKWQGKLTPKFRKLFTAAGWKFGSSIYAVLRCPACKSHGAREDAADRREIVAMAAEILGDDEDGLVSFLEEME